MANITDATLYLWIYTGTFGSKPANPNYVLSKIAKQGEETIVFEIAELVKDYVDVTFTGDYNNIIETAWVEWQIVQNYDDLSTQTQIGESMATNGYGYFKDGLNPILKKGALINNNIIYTIPAPSSGSVDASSTIVSADSTTYTADNSGSVTVENNLHIPIYTGVNGAYKADYYQGNTLLRTDVFGSNISAITADIDTINVDSTSYTVDMTEVAAASSNVIIRVIPPVNTTKVIVTNNDNTTETITIKVIQECKYTPYKVSFVNQYGVVQDLWFFKRRDEKVQISKGNYLQNTIKQSATGVSYSLNQASQVPTDFKVTKSLKLNTGFIDEQYNEIIQELMLTESAWIHEDSNVYPILPTTSSLDYKTQLNDKLINFTVDFEYAYNEINLIK